MKINLCGIAVFSGSVNAALRQLAYCSAASTTEVTDESIQNLLTVSRKNNKENDVTGILLYKNLSFFQCIEGEEEAIDATILRIMRDTRHKLITILYNKEIEEREFTSWSMAYRQPDYIAWSQTKTASNQFLNYVKDPTGFDHPLSRRVRIILTTFEELMNQA